MKDLKTNDELIKELLTPEEQNELKDEIEKEVTKLWGGKREGSGRKPKTGNVLEFHIRVSKKEKDFINYARAHNINYEDLMQG